MKVIRNFYPLILALGILASTSCKKDVQNNESKPKVDTTNNDTANTSDDARFLVLNLLDTTSGNIVNVEVNGKQLVSDLGVQEVSRYIDIDPGQLVVTVRGKNNELLVFSSLKLESRKVYTILLTSGINGIQPKIGLLELPSFPFNDSPNFLAGLGLPVLPVDIFRLNVLNLTSGLGADKLLVGTEYLNNIGALVPGFMDLPKGDFSGIIAGNGDILNNLSLLSSSLQLNDLLGQVKLINPGSNLLDIGGVTGIVGGLGVGSISKILNDLLLSNLLGLNTVKLIGNGSLLSGLDMLPGRDYTLLLFGDGNNPKVLLIDQTLARLR